MLARRIEEMEGLRLGEVIASAAEKAADAAARRVAAEVATECAGASEGADDSAGAESPREGPWRGAERAPASHQAGQMSLLQLFGAWFESTAKRCAHCQPVIAAAGQQTSSRDQRVIDEIARLSPESHNRRPH